MVDIFGIISIDASYLVLILAGTLLLSIITLILAIIGIVKASKLKKRYNQFMTGSDGESIEKLIKSNLKDVKEIRTTTRKNSEAVTDIYEKLNYTFCKIGVNKYDAFHEMGGKLSFALCMLDKRNDGYLINVMHSNNGCFAYVKEIIDGQSYIEMGEDEAKAVKMAVAGKMGDVELSKEINDMVQRDKK